MNLGFVSPETRFGSRASLAGLIEHLDFGRRERAVVDADVVDETVEETGSRPTNRPSEELPPRKAVYQTVRTPEDSASIRSLVTSEALRFSASAAMIRFVHLGHSREPVEEQNVSAFERDDLEPAPHQLVRALAGSRAALRPSR